MDGLIEVVFKNPFLLVLILGGIFSLLRRRPDQNKEEHENQEGQQSEQKTREEPSTTSRNIPPPVREQLGDMFEEAIRGRTASNEEQADQQVSIDEQRELQVKRLADQYRTSEHSGLTEKAKAAEERREIEIKKTAAPYSRNFKNDFEKTLTQKGLVNSIVMAEVLGAPRARSPYQSVVIKRIKSK